MEGSFGVLWGCWGGVRVLFGGCWGVVGGLFGGCLGVVGRLLAVCWPSELCLSTFCYFALPGMHATWPTASFSGCF